MPHVLMLHGLTASPGQLVPLKEYLEDAGITVHAPLLPGHGTTPADLARTTWRDWYDAAVRAIADVPEPVDVVGLSMGTLLALHLAATAPQRVRRLVCISTPLFLPCWMRALLAVVRHTPLRYVVPTWKKDYSRAVRDPEGRAVYRASSYDRFPLPAVVEFTRLQKTAAADLPNVHQPTLIIHPLRDFTAAPRGATYVADHLAGPHELVWLEESYHVATLDLERERVADLTLKFLQRA